MKTRRKSKTIDTAPNFQGLLENLHSDSQESFSQNSCAVIHSTLADASNQDVVKLLDRASLRGAAVKEQSKRAGVDLNPKGNKRGKRKVSLEGETGLFYQRRGSRESHPEGQVGQSGNPNPLVCGALASTLVDVKYGGHNVQDNISSLKKFLSPEEDCIVGGSGSKVEGNPDELLGNKHEHFSDLEVKDKNISKDSHPEEDGFDWEVGLGIPEQDDTDKGWTGEISIEVDDGTAGTAEKQGGRRLVRRATAKDKEFAELVHKAHLLCLLARGRVVDSACNDQLLQASLLSMVPPHINFCDTERFTASMLGPLVKWFQSTFRVCPHPAQMDAQEDLTACLTSALGRQAGTSEEVAALSVALLRALGFTTRYVTVLDVASLKPDANSLEASADWDSFANGEDEYIFSQRYGHNTTAVSLGQILARCAPPLLCPDTTIKSPQISISSEIDISNSGSPGFEGRRGRSGRGRGRGRKGEGKKILEDSALPSCSQSVQSDTQNAGRGRGKSALRASNREASSNSPDVPLDAVEVQEVEMSKRKGDKEFELQLAMAMAATAAAVGQKSPERDKQCADLPCRHDGTTISSRGTSACNAGDRGKLQNQDNINSSKKDSTTGGAVWSRKMGPLLHWAEVYCDGEGADGRWLHVDAGRGILDGAGVVEGAAASCKFPLRYVLAFAGNGAKDVTRRYVTLWSTVAPLRVESDWWNMTLAPLKELEAAATAGTPFSVSLQRSSTSAMTDAYFSAQEKPTSSRKLDYSLDSNDCRGTGYDEALGNASTTAGSSQPIRASERSSLEDMELEVRAYTEPLPTNQQAYKNHHLYLLEKWLTKYQSLHPKGPVLGYCAGQPVFPRTCVQNLHTAERWLREGLKVRPGESPAKIVKNSRLTNKQAIDDIGVLVDDGSGEAPVTALFGKWQTDPWQPPPAVDGIVPKNERGNVDVWSEKCLPPGTVHLRLPRMLPIAKKLGIDFAPAMVGFDIRNRRSVPVFEGIVICQEHETVLLEAYAEEEQRRSTELEKKKEDQAVARWRQLLRCIATRQRLQATYEVPDTEVQQLPVSSAVENCQTLVGRKTKVSQMLDTQNPDCVDVGSHVKATNAEQQLKHEHTFPEENQSFDEESGICRKTCPCGFTLTVEEM